MWSSSDSWNVGTENGENRVNSNAEYLSLAFPAFLKLNVKILCATFNNLNFQNMSKDALHVVEH